MEQHDENKALQRFLSDHGLAGQYLAQAITSFLPVAELIAARKKALAESRPLLISLVGSQGSGKTTLSELLALSLRQSGFRVECFSLDDFYLRRSERIRLAQEVHPLLATRGVPGTHDMGLLREVMEGLLAGESVTIPRFDKSRDDRFPAEMHTHVNGTLDIILLEGWCWGALSQSQTALQRPINALEQAEDAERVWRSYSNQVLRSDFEPLYRKVDSWLMLKAPSFNCVYRWRLEQEQKLARSRSDDSGSEIMDAAGIRRFISFFQRITEQLLEELPERADLVWHLDSHRQVQDMTGPWLSLLSIDSAIDQPYGPIR